MRYILGVLAVVVVAFLAIFAIANRGSNPSGGTPPDKTVSRLSTQANNNIEIVMTQRGRIVGDDSFRSVRIRITAESRTIEILDGYNQTVERSQNFSNNQTAFTELLFALDNSGYTRKQTPRYTDSRGVCATGNVYFYDYVTQDNQKHELWSSSCSTGDGNFGGSNGLVRQIVQNQITNYNKFITNVQL